MGVCWVSEAKEEKQESLRSQWHFSAISSKGEPWKERNVKKRLGVRREAKTLEGLSQILE